MLAIAPTPQRKRGRDGLPLLESQFDPRMRYHDTALMRQYRDLFNIDLIHHVAGIMINKVCVRAHTYNDDDAHAGNERRDPHQSRRLHP